MAERMSKVTECTDCMLPTIKFHCIEFFPLQHAYCLPVHSMWIIIFCTCIAQNNDLLQVSWNVIWFYVFYMGRLYKGVFVLYPLLFRGKCSFGFEIYKQNGKHPNFISGSNREGKKQIQILNPYSRNLIKSGDTFCTFWHDSIPDISKYRVNALIFKDTKHIMIVTSSVFFSISNIMFSFLLFIWKTLTPSFFKKAYKQKKMFKGWNTCLACTCKIIFWRIVHEKICFQMWKLLTLKDKFTLCGMCFRVGNPGKYTSSLTCGKRPFTILSGSTLNASTPSLFNLKIIFGWYSPLHTVQIFQLG